MLPGRLTPTCSLGLILLLGAALRVFPVWFGLPYPYARPDEAVSISRAMGILAGDLNPHFFHWPSLTFYLLAAAFAAVSALRRLLSLDPSLTRDTAVIVARTVMAVAGTLTLVPLYLLARRIAGVRAGLLAAGFLAVAVLHVRDSHFAMTDVLTTLLSTAALAALAAAFDAGTAGGDQPMPIRGFAVAGLLAGLATSTKYSAAALLAAAGAAHLLLLVRLRRAPWSPRTWGAPAALLAASALGFVAATPFAVLDAAAFSADLRYDFLHLSDGHGINLGRGWYYHLTQSLPYGCGPLVFAAAFAGLVVTARQHRDHALIVGAFAAAFYAAIGSGYTVFFRYVMPLVPVVCLFAAVAVDRGAALVTAYTRLPGSAAAALLALCIGGSSLAASVRLDLLLARTDSRVVAGQWLTPRLQPGMTLHDAGGDYARLDLAGVRYHEWHFTPQTGSFGHPLGLTPDWLVLPSSPLRQYANAPPGLRQLARDRYDLVFSVRGAGDTAQDAVYDQQDAFFLPLSGFDSVERPGPDIAIYRRRD